MKRNVVTYIIQIISYMISINCSFFLTLFIYALIILYDTPLQITQDSQKQNTLILLTLIIGFLLNNGISFILFYKNLSHLNSTIETIDVLKLWLKPLLLVIILSVVLGIILFYRGLI